MAASNTPCILPDGQGLGGEWQQVSNTSRVLKTSKVVNRDLLKLVQTTYAKDQDTPPFMGRYVDSSSTNPFPLGPIADLSAQLT